MEILKRLRNSIGSLRRTYCFSKHAYLKPEKPIITFTFDDVPVSAFEIAKAILDRERIKGTFYLSMSVVRKIPDARELLNQAVQNGHEMACHTYGHLRLTRHTAREIVEDMDRNQAVFNQLIPDYSFHSFSYPFGLFSATVKSLVHERFQSARSIQAGLNLGYTDLNRLKAIKLYEQLSDLNSIFSLVNNAIERRAWLIFYTHDVCEGFSEYGCSPQYFKELVRYCKQKDAEILNVAGALGLARHPYRNQSNADSCVK